MDGGAGKGSIEPGRVKSMASRASVPSTLDTLHCTNSVPGIEMRVYLG